MERADEVFDQQFREVQAIYPTWTDVQIRSEVFKRQHELLEERARQASEKQAKFLLKGKYDGLFQSTVPIETIPEGRVLREYVEETKDDMVITNINLFDEKD